MLLVTLNFQVQGVRYCYAHVTPADFNRFDREWVSALDLQLMYDACTLSSFETLYRFVHSIDPTLPATYAILGVRCKVEHTELTRLTF